MRTDPSPKSASGGARPVEALRLRLAGLDGKDYGAYQSLLGTFAYPRFTLSLDRIPKDPFAPPGTGSFRATVPWKEAGFADRLLASRTAAVALRDFLARRFHEACARLSPGRRGTGNSGLVTIAEPGQSILERSSIRADGGAVEARFFIGLPAGGRRVDARTARTMLLEELPRIVEASLFRASADRDALERHVRAAEDAEHLRGRLPALGLVAFVADGAVLPRASGVDPRPLREGRFLPFRSPESLRVSVELPHAGPVAGMGIPEGVTLIVGGGYHGKSTLLTALELGIYNHVPGDGRERVVSLPTTVKVRASSGRSVAGVDISAFINNLPLGQGTESFSTANASGSTSQAAFVTESIEAGARLLLLDEDTCAANFMIRDARMQRLVARSEEPITAFVDRVRRLHRELGVSTILVMGGSGDYFDVADCIIQMAEFEPRDVTARAREIVAAAPTTRSSEGLPDLARPADRRPLGAGLDPRSAHGHFRISAREPRRLVFGASEIDLSDVEQLEETAQTLAIGHAIERARGLMDGGLTMRELVGRVMREVAEGGLDALEPRRTGNLAAFRGLDLAAALNRFRGLAVRRPG